jgi:NHL repeat
MNVDRRSHLDRLAPVLWALLIAALALAVRLVPAMSLHGLAADVATEFRRGWSSVNGDNLYAAEYPYTPLSQWFSALAFAVSRLAGVRFELVFKLLLIAGDLLVLGWLRSALAERGSPRRIVVGSCLLWALNPVSVLVSSVHGNPSTLVAVAMLGTWRYLERYRSARRRPDLALAATLFGIAVALRGFPILATPALVLLGLRRWRERAVFVAVAAVPTLAVSIPYLVHLGTSMVRNMASYSGNTDFGWLAAVRAFAYLHGGSKFGVYDPAWLADSKVAFLAAVGLSYAALRLARESAYGEAVLLPFLLFYGVYGGVSAQYLVWIVPLAIVVAPAFAALFSIVAAGAMLCFYVVYHPGILFGAGPRRFGENPTVIALSSGLNAALAILCLVFATWIVVGWLGERRTAGGGEPHAQGARNAAGKRSALLVGTSMVLLCVALVGLYLGPGRSPGVDAASAAVEPAAGPDVEAIWAVPGAAAAPPTAETGPTAPWAIRAAADGTLFVLDFQARRLTVHEPGGASRALDLGPGEFLGMDVAPGGGLAVLDSSAMRVSVFEPPWRSPPRRLQLDPAGAYNPRGLAVDGHGQYLVADTGGHRILVYDGDGRLSRVDECASCPSPLGEISDVTTGWDDSIFAADGERGVVQLTPEGSYLASYGIAGRGGLEGTRLARGPGGAVFASALGRVSEILPSGRVVVRAGGTGWPYAPLGQALSVAWDGSSRQLWIGDRAGRSWAPFRLPAGSEGEPSPVRKAG